MNEPNVAVADDRQKISQPLDVDPPGDFGAQLTGSQSTVARTIEHAAKLILVEQPGQLSRVFGVAGDDSFAVQTPVVLLTNADHLPRITSTEIIQRIVAR